MISRKLALPTETFFLFGPRGTGKTTWLKEKLSGALWYNLLDTKEYLRLLKEPSVLRQEVLACKERSWIVIDEIQRIPALLDEIHLLLTDHDHYLFALTGSSARKLKRSHANLLAGRAITKAFCPLTMAELGFKNSLAEVLSFGSLPRVLVGTKKASSRINRLEAYVDTYLKEEIQQETRLRDLASFGRFLDIAAICNGQVVNVSNIARDSGVARQTVQGYFEVLIDTLLGEYLPAWEQKARIKEVKHPKFYLFDTGVVRALQGRLREPVTAVERGFLLETLLFNELRAYRAIADVGGRLYYWGTPSKAEIDFIWERGDAVVGIEVKSTSSWKSEYSRSLQELLDEKKITKGYGVYLGDRPLVSGKIKVLPVADFLRQLSAGTILK